MHRQHRPANECQFPSWDDTQLFYRHWPATDEVGSDRALILFHGGHEHSGRFQELVEGLELPVHVFAWDARAHGRSPGQRGYARHFMNFVRDADAFARHIGQQHGIEAENMAVLGHSVGSVIAAAWVHDYAPPVRAMVLGSPAFDVKLYVPLAKPGLRLIERFRPNAFVNSYVKPGMLTHDAAEAEARRNDPLIAPPIAVRVLNSLYDTVDRLMDGAGSIQTPTLLLSAGRDFVVHTSAQDRFMERLGSDTKALHRLPGFYHEVFHEAERGIPIGLARDFLRTHLLGPATPTRPAREGNRERYAGLSRERGALDPKHHAFKAMAMALRMGSGLSEGLRIGQQHGFDSGPMLDYVYRNVARGRGPLAPLGRLVDRNYLNSPGWQGIRQRRVHLKQAVGTAIDELKTARPDGETIHVADLAAGPGRYLLDVLEARHADRDHIRITCRDRDEQGLSEGRDLAADHGFTQVKHETGDAFDPASIASLTPAPDIVVVSGLYELFADNGAVLRSLRGIRAVLPEHGRLIVTNQPWHPQLELIARTLPNRDGQPWVMRPRPAAEMNALLREAGFEPGPMLSDNDGIFTVTTASVAA
ncbi:MAG: bifunctional alpha/beta hydrolase/class I SAM-dependent methyltransferase [Gammaproteobacteria bacterium]